VKLYHYTSRLHLPFIKEEGITRGDVPLTRSPKLGADGVNAVWLTEDDVAANQKWSALDTESDVDIINKRAIRLRIDANVLTMPPGSSELVKWEYYARRMAVERGWYRTLDRVGGYGARHWWLYFGVVPWAAVVKVDDLAEPTPLEAAVLAGKMKVVRQANGLAVVHA
jgi:hypothetical protein